MHSAHAKVLDYDTGNSLRDTTGRAGTVRAAVSTHFAAVRARAPSKPRIRLRLCAGVKTTVESGATLDVVER